MSAFKGTPGPWFAGEQSDISGWVEIRVPGYSRNPVACATPAAAGDAEARRDAETLANARLIAAAPDSHEANVRMVDALNDAFGISPEWDDERIYDELPSSSVSAAYFAARAAIEKATGGAA